ncbi:tripartite tricarboxylate transporter substrate binding protein [Polynucleobacter kasalickyi]|uniref:Tripartite-type tricarboxylate transporter, receptor component TctC n=1 Tax=Polynucleobacter kasalickyi TaxID=1938817 RepID=A0A1W2B5N5_9BURK|nr:tripartite tricarboxylate transporter substrate binding protein [Polynucleobacter kasalickyi]SMC68307.1 Tripartite-type tricarboxylate transporter, receptor component TctC [Polynucleobacter kasalickyi]
MIRHLLKKQNFLYFPMVFVGLLLSLITLNSGCIQAQEIWPTRPITMVVPFPPGGVADTVGRPIAEALGRQLGQPVIIENKAGAGGGVGMAAVSKAKPDGYTILMTLSSISIIPEADKILGKEISYRTNQFAPIARFTADPTVLVVRADSPWKNYAEFVAGMKKTPGKFNFGSSGNYGTMHIPMEMIKLNNQFEMAHIPYTGAGPAIVALLGGQVDAIATGPASIVQHIKGGKVRALAHWGDGRLASLPDVPSFKELGEKVEFAQWSGLFVPKDTPLPIVEKLRAASKAAVNDEKVKMVLEGAGSPIQFLDAPEFQKYWDNDAKKMSDIVKKIGKVE